MSPAIQDGVMAKGEEACTQLATRIPKGLHRRLKLHCMTNEIAVMDFVIEAIREKLGRKVKAKKRAA
jgi:predicted HicB family RNase H-like nuclease